MKVKFCFLLFISNTLLFAQNIEFTKDNFKDNKPELKEAINNLEKGNELFEKGEFYYKKAISPYLLAYKFNPNNALLNFKLGKCYLYTNSKSNSIQYLEKAYLLNKTVSPEIHYWLGKAYHYDMQWDKAIAEFRMFQKLISGPENKNLNDDAVKEVTECFDGKELQKNPVRVLIENVGEEINSPYADLDPVISADESILIFTSRRPNTTGGKKDNDLNEYFEDIYFSEKKDKRWTTCENIGKPINTEGHDANSGISIDGQKIILYYDKNNGDLFESHLNGNSWTKPERLNKNINTEFHESSACFSPDGRKIYFISDRPGGSGGSDIYVSTLDEKGDWGKAVNIGSTINTKYDEETVFIHPDGRTLYFSSKGHNTIGGFDIFKSVIENGEWSVPENIGMPINSINDDICFVISANGKHGYYSTFNSEKGYGDKDIYRITFYGEEKPMVLTNEFNLLASQQYPIKEKITVPTIIVKSLPLTLVKGIITDANTHVPLEASIEITDNSKNEIISTISSNSATGKYLISLPVGKNYGIAIKKENYLFDSENFDLTSTNNFQSLINDFSLKNLDIGNKIILNNIFFDANKSILRPESNKELGRIKTLLNDNSKLKIEISSYVDSKEIPELNEKLSEDRAKAIADYLVKNGTKIKRLTFVGYGKNQLADSKDAQKGGQEGSKIELKILSK